MIYDKAYELARSLAESKEYQAFLTAKKNVQEDEAAFRMLADFRRHQVELQARQMMGETISEDKLGRLHQLVELMQHKQNVQAFLETEERLGRVMADIHRILGEGIKEWFDFTEFLNDLAGVNELEESE
ncbi:MAG TPA: YlbF family regulator [Firmicutes bacterium]|nr:YlbF family regulator [Bacillota bacterium]